MRIMHPSELLATFVHEHPRVFVLTGAGVSTASGIPGYRDADGNWQRKPPVTHQEFTAGEAVRKRYWARSLIGWPTIAEAAPNPAHEALARLERLCYVAKVTTQNVDGLHQRAGSESVIDLHGRLDRVACLDCGAIHDRSSIQASMLQANPEFANRAADVAPDGDADLHTDCDAFNVPVCPLCGGMLKPDVVFFGANVPRQRVDAAFGALEEADAALVVGSSLMAYSGYRFCERAHAAGKPIVAINRGRTRADNLLALKVDADCGATLTALVRQLAN
jgi:NAD-dependent SIR2 family protein deacetylase